MCNLVDGYMSTPGAPLDALAGEATGGSLCGLGTFFVSAIMKRSHDHSAYTTAF